MTTDHHDDQHGDRFEHRQYRNDPEQQSGSPERPVRWDPDLRAAVNAGREVDNATEDLDLAVVIGGAGPDLVSQLAAAGYTWTLTTPYAEIYTRSRQPVNHCISSSSARCRHHLRAAPGIGPGDGHQGTAL